MLAGPGRLTDFTGSPSTDELAKGWVLDRANQRTRRLSSEAATQREGDRACVQVAAGRLLRLLTARDLAVLLRAACCRQVLRGPSRRRRGASEFG